MTPLCGDACSKLARPTCACERSLQRREDRGAIASCTQRDKTVQQRSFQGQEGLEAKSSTYRPPPTAR